MDTTNNLFKNLIDLVKHSYIYLSQPECKRNFKIQGREFSCHEKE